jgi:hypothetical protein
VSTTKAINDADFRAGYQSGWRDALDGEGQVPPPQQSQDFRAGYDQGYQNVSKRPVRRGK